MTVDIVSHRLDFDGSLVFRDGGSGRVWLLQDAAAEACRDLDDAEISEVLAATPGLPDEPMLLAGQAWTPPSDLPALDRCIAGGGPLLRVRVWDRRLATVLAAMIQPLVVRGDPASTVDLFVDGTRTVLAHDGVVALETEGIGWWILVRWIARALRPERAWAGVLHAATVVTANGRAVAIAGMSGAGKTTLAGALVASGARLLSDDATPIEAGSMLAWPCPLAMGVKRGSWPVFSDLFDGFPAVPPVRFGRSEIRYFPAPLTVRNEGHPVAAFVFPAWRAGASLQAERLRPSDTLRLLIGSGTEPARSGAYLVDLLEWIEAVPAWRLEYGDLGEAVGFVQNLGAAGDRAS